MSSGRFVERDILSRYGKPTVRRAKRDRRASMKAFGIRAGGESGFSRDERHAAATDKANTMLAPGGRPARGKRVGIRATGAGDVCGPYQNGAWTPPDGAVSINMDAVAGLDAFRGMSTPKFAWADMQSYACFSGASPSPMGPRIDINDITFVLDAFRGLAYADCLTCCPMPSGWSATPGRPSNPYYFTGRRLDFNLRAGSAEAPLGILPPGTASGTPVLTLYDYRARFYDALNGRFLQRDPAAYGDAMNLYEYVGSHPTFATDWSGMEKHHWLPQASWRKLNLSAEVRRVFDETIPLPYQREYTTEHKLYNQAAGEIADKYLARVGKTSLEQLNVAEARGLVNAIKTSPEPAIREFINSGGAKYLGRTPPPTARPGGSIGRAVGGAFLVVLTIPSVAQAGEIPAWDRFNQNQCTACVCRRITRIMTVPPWYDFLREAAIDDAAGPEVSHGYVTVAQCRAKEWTDPPDKNAWYFVESSLGYSVYMIESYACSPRRR